MDTRYLYVMGAGSGVGKSSICLGILAQLLAAGFTPAQLAYIKPVTQCVIKQPVALFCDQHQIACVDIGPLVFHKGFSRDYIAGLTPSSDTLLAGVMASIHAVAEDKAVVIIDGVGHPAVGSVVGVSNADVAHALPCKVLFVGNAGIGAAIIKQNLSKRLSALLQNAPLLGFVVQHGSIDDQNVDNIARWFSTALDQRVLFDWLGLNCPSVP